MSQVAIPSGPEELTPEWFTAVFRENALLTVRAVVRLQTDIIGQNTGFTGVIARVQLQYAGHKGTAPSSVVVKLPTAHPGTPSAYRAAQEKDETAARRYVERCVREVLFYQQFAPLTSLPVPHLYYAAADEAAGRVVLVLEDFHAARIGDALHGCSPEDATVVIDQLAHFHAQWWNHSQLNESFWLPLWGGDSQAAQNRYMQCIEPFLQRFGQRVPKRVREMIEALATHYGAVRTRLQQAPVTMIHSDLHLDNILFHAPQQTPPMTIIDWQSVARGRGTIDLASLLFGSLDTSTRRTVESDLLRRYHERLVAGGVTGYDMPQLLEDCRLTLLWLLGAQVVWRGSLDLDRLNGREQALVDSLTEDDFAALFDYHADSLLSR